ncbi:MAG: hypothetical protein GPOALKHO_001073 [Sodalis sp.]|nr:MAG: hypothetical protein GPOALKHO_001073 [Sodalis sp.]
MVRTELNVGVLAEVMAYTVAGYTRLMDAITGVFNSASRQRTAASVIRSASDRQ